MRAIFLDRDGVINPLIYDSDHGTLDSPLNPEQFELLPGVGAGLRLFNNAGYMTFIISNQPAIAKGKITEKLFEEIENKMFGLLSDEECRVDASYYCFHHPEAIVSKYRGACSCRKPEPGLLVRAAKEKGLKKEESFFIGDGLTDIEAGKIFGSKTVLIGNDKCDICRKSKEKGLIPDIIATDLEDAALKILGGS